MVRQVAFLRGINVGGRNLIKMEDLSRAFKRSGFKNVSTYIQSGNVIFDAAENGSQALSRTIEKKLRSALGQEVTVVVRTIGELESILRRNPFKKIKPGASVMLFVAFFSDEPRSQSKLPLKSAGEKLDVIAVQDRTAFIVARRKNNGWFGFPNNFIEKQLGVTATTRNWTTVGKLVAFARQTNEK